MVVTYATNGLRFRDTLEKLRQVQPTSARKSESCNGLMLQ
jgi:hypothetical protein